MRGLLRAGGLGTAAVASLGLVFVVVRRVDAAREVGLALGEELIEGARTLASGVYVVAPFRRPLDVVELLPEPG